VVPLLTPEPRSQRGRIGGYALHSKVDSTAHTAAAREAFLSRFEREVDPEGILDPEERVRRAAHARKAYFARLAFLSAKARARKAAAP
jgi:hypothetical protein